VACYPTCQFFSGLDEMRGNSEAITIRYNCGESMDKGEHGVAFDWCGIVVRRCKYRQPFFDGHGADNVFSFVN
jgi:hypothetical protein